MVYSDKRIVAPFLFPALILIAAFLYYPFLGNILGSLRDPSSWVDPGRFVGLDNYRRMAVDPTIRRALLNTGFFLVVVVAFQAGGGLLLALLVDAAPKGKGVFQTIFFLPIVVSSTAIGILFQLVYAFNGGLLNGILAAAGQGPKHWLSPEGALAAVAVPVVWQYVGFYFVIIYTAIVRLPRDFYESALLDGASAWTRMTKLTIPLIWDVLRSVLVMAITGSLKIFDLVWIVTGGGPKDATHTLGTYLYKTSFDSQRIGYGSAIAVLIVAVGLVVSLFADRLTNRESIEY